MARRPNIVRSQSLHITLPEDIYARLQLHLYSDLQRRVPVGAYQKFITERVQEFFTPSQCTCSKPCPVHGSGVMLGLTPGVKSDSEP